MRMVKTVILRRGPVKKGDCPMKENAFTPNQRWSAFGRRWLETEQLVRAFLPVAWLVCILVFPALTSAKNIYVAQNGQGLANGQDAPDAYPLTWLNNAANWGSGVSQFNPGDTAVLVGTITQQIVIQASGNPGQPYTIGFNPGANMTSPAWPSSGAINIGNHSWITIDGGPGYAIIQNTDNGTLLGNQVNSSLIYASGGNYNETGLEIKRLKLLNCFVHQMGSTSGGGNGIYINSNGTNVFVHDCYVTNANTGINLVWGSAAGAGGSDNFKVYNCSAVGCNWDIALSIGSDAHFAGTAMIYSNYCGGNWVWDTGAPDTFHHNGVMVFVGPAGSSVMTNIYIFNNLIGPDLSYTSNGNDTAWIFVDWNGNGGCFQNVYIYNNVLWAAPGFGPQNGFITGGARNFNCFNNTIYGANYGGGMGGGSTGQTNIYTNNILCNISANPIGDNSGSQTYSDYNLFYNCPGNFNAQGSSVSLTGWQALGRDTHSLTVNPLFVNAVVGNLMLQSNSPAIGAGANLSSYFNYDMAGNIRPRSGAWDLGAYQYSSTTNLPLTTNYTITASAGTGGAIVPSGSVLVTAGGSQSFAIIPSSGYLITNVMVDSTNVGAVSSYTFSSVVTNHTISASFISTGIVPPSAPANLSANPVSPSEIDLSWTASTAGTYAIAGYHVYANGAATPTASVTTTSYKSTGLSANAANSYVVRAYDTSGNESAQSTVTAVTWPLLSTKFILGGQVSIITGPANIRQQPTNEVAGAVIGTQPAGAVATVVGGPIYAALNSVFYYWWDLSFSSSPSGWVAEDNLQAYSAPVNPVIQVSAGSIPFGTVLAGASVTNSFTVSNAGGGTLSGTASVSAPFGIVSGASYNLASNQSQTVVVVFNPTTAGSYNQNVTLTGGGGAAVAVSGTATNATVALPTVSAIAMNVTDVDLNLAGLQIYSGTTVNFSATATNAQAWQWSYTVNGGSPVIYTNSTSPLTNISCFFGTNTVGNSYEWTLVVSNGQNSAQSQTNFSVETTPGGAVTTNIIQGPTISATSGTLSGLLTAKTTINGVTTTYFYQPLPSIGSTSGGTATYNVTVTNAGNYEIQALVYAPNLNANSFLVNIDGQPQNPTMIWDIMPVTSGFEQRLVCWRGSTGSENNDTIVPKIFSLAAGTHQIVFVGREPGTAMASFSLLQVVTTVQSPTPPSSPTGLRIISSSP